MTTAIRPASEWSVVCNDLMPEQRKFRDKAFVDDDLRKMIIKLWDDRGPWPLLIHGEAGSGKTCAGLCAWDGCGGWFGELKDLCDLHRRAKAKEAYHTGGYLVSQDDLYGYWHRAPMCVIDEIGMRSPSDFQFEVFKALLDGRENKPLIVCSNLEPDNLGLGLETNPKGGIYDDRIMSRLSCGTQYKLTGDRRMQ